MKRASLGPLARAVMLLVGVATVGATALRWQYFYAMDMTTGETIVAATPLAVIGVVMLNDTVRG